MTFQNSNVSRCQTFLQTIEHWFAISPLAKAVYFFHLEENVISYLVPELKLSIADTSIHKIKN
jgi:hypothetical protein